MTSHLYDISSKRHPSSSLCILFNKKQIKNSDTHTNRLLHSSANCPKHQRSLCEVLSKNQRVHLTLKLDAPFSKVLTLSHIYHPLPHSTHVLVCSISVFMPQKCSENANKGRVRCKDGGLDNCPQLFIYLLKCVSRFVTTSSA